MLVFVHPGVSRAADLCQAGTPGFGSILPAHTTLLSKDTKLIVYSAAWRYPFAETEAD